MFGVLVGGNELRVFKKIFFYYLFGCAGSSLLPGLFSSCEAGAAL